MVKGGSKKYSVKIIEKDEKKTDDLFTDVTPWPEAVNGAELLDEIEEVFITHGVYREGCTEALALWVLFTYVFDEFFVCPLLIISSPEKRCGKTQTLRMVGKLVHRPVISSNITPSALFRLIEESQPTILIDEADTFMVNRSNEIVGIMNSGHTKDTAFIVRNVEVNGGWKPSKFSVWAPKCIAYIDQKKVTDTLLDRAVEIPMRRKTREETIEPLRAAKLQRIGIEIQRKATRWGNDHRLVLSGAEDETQIPEELNDRQADNWAPLLAIADVASADWPAKAARSARILSKLADNEEPSEGILLLSDCRKIFREKGNPDRIHTRDLKRELETIFEHPWGEYGISERALADKLKAFEIEPKGMRIKGGKPKRGYYRKHFEEAFARYLPEESVTSATSETNTIMNGQTLIDPYSV